jgi:predicted amidohydrolase
MSATVRVGAACAGFTHDKDANLGVLEDYIRTASSDAVQLLVFPECAVQGYPMKLTQDGYDDHYQQLRDAEPVPGPALERLASLAKEQGVEVVVGLTERPDEPGSSGKVYNSVAFLSDGRVTGRYRKVHTGNVEKTLWSRGEDWTVCDSVAGRLGFLICYDLVFPEAARCLALAGAELLVMSTAWTKGPIEEGYDLFTRARALENQVFLLASNQTGGPDGVFSGHSRIVSPRGELLAESAGEGIAVADLDVEEGMLDARARGWLGQVFLSDRAPTAYRSLADS